MTAEALDPELGFFDGWGAATEALAELSEKLSSEQGIRAGA
ncbi:hypothetical protein [Pseudoclavibacter sp. JSM 162008]